MSEYRKEHLLELIRTLSGEFLARESGNGSLLTVTRVEITENMKNGIIFISVFPEDKEISALHFVKRQLTDLRMYLLERIRTGRLPFLEVQIDEGEKLRNKMDKLL